jgi:hypothetical protein
MATFAIRHGNRRFENLFFCTIAFVILLSVFIGFARTYYLAGVFKAPLPNLLIHVHGAAFSLWILLLIAQTSLVATDRVDVHRHLGVAGFSLACLMVILGPLAATDFLRRQIASGGPAMEFSARAFYAIPLSDIFLFTILIFFAFRNRSNPPAHKRLILIATITLLDAAFARWPFSHTWWNLHIAQACSYPLLLSIIAFDLWSTRKIHPATLWPSISLVLLQQLRFPLGRTAVWQAFAAWMSHLSLHFH